MANAQFPGLPRIPGSSSSESVGAPRALGPMCPGCGERVDPLRAGHVAVLEGRFRYFCHADCKQAYLQAHGKPLEEDVPTAKPPEVARILEAGIGRGARSSPRINGSAEAPPAVAVADAEAPRAHAEP